jgi:hypothetical protein
MAQPILPSQITTYVPCNSGFGFYLYGMHELKFDLDLVNDHYDFEAERVVVTTGRFAMTVIALEFFCFWGMAYNLLGLAFKAGCAGYVAYKQGRPEEWVPMLSQAAQHLTLAAIDLVAYLLMAQLWGGQLILLAFAILYSMIPGLILNVANQKSQEIATFWNLQTQSYLCPVETEHN